MDYETWSYEKLRNEIKIRNIFTKNKSKLTKKELISLLELNDTYKEIIENFEVDISAKKVFIENIAPLDTRNVAKRKQRFLTQKDNYEINEIFQIIRDETPLISLLPYQTKTIENANEIFEVVEILWYYHANSLLYTIKNGMYVYIHFDIQYDAYDYDLEEKTENVRLYVNDSLESIVKYAMSQNIYDKYISKTESYTKALIPRNYNFRYDKDHDPERFFDHIINHMYFNNIVYLQKVKPKFPIEKFDKIYWANLHLYSDKVNRLIFKYNKFFYLLYFRQNKHINYYGEPRLEYESVIYVSNKYSDIIDFLPQDEYEIYLSETSE